MQLARFKVLAQSRVNLDEDKQFVQQVDQIGSETQPIKELPEGVGRQQSAEWHKAPADAASVFARGWPSLLLQVGFVHTVICVVCVCVCGDCHRHSVSQTATPFTSSYNIDEAWPLRGHSRSNERKSKLPG